MKKPTKYYSSRQEHMVADYLGWDVVSGSGARDFNPGDIRSDDFLGECKTFTKESDTIYCYHKVWDKISKEAMAVFRKPILFVDNGTQNVVNTWCIVPKYFINMIPHFKLLDVEISESTFKLSTTRVSFSHKHTKQYLCDNDTSGIPFKLGNTDVVLLSLSVLKTIFEG